MLVKRRIFPCNAEQLRLLLEDALPTTTHDEVVGHLDDCADCQQALEELAAEKKWWDELPQINDLHSGQTTIQSPPTVADKGAPFALDFLDPAADSEHLGRLGPFAVTAVLGRGGFGVVLKAFDAALNRHVAIKVLAPYFASSGAARKRFAREAQAAATVVHPHVVPIHSVDLWKGLPYLVMAYVPGRPLQERLDSDGLLDVKEVLRIGMQTASGLAAAHAQGLVHRDVKPANILLENGLGRVWLTDFGLARAVDDASLTQSGVIAGTPQYMAPEQAQGNAVDHRADLFSLGSTLYTMCTAHPPFRAESALAVLRRVCEDAPRPIRQVNPEIPNWLTGIIEKLHAKEPADRFQTAHEVADLLGKCLAHIQQPDTNPLPREAAELSPSRPDRNRLASWGALLLISLVLGAVAIPLRSVWRGDPITLEKGESPKRAVSVPVHEVKAANVPGLDDEPLESQVAKLRTAGNALDNELKQSSAPGYRDPTDELLRETQRRLNVLEKELTVPVPQKGVGAITSGKGEMR
jgi:serine/threonine protein kinase